MSVCWKNLTENDNLFATRQSVEELAKNVLHQHVMIISDQVKLDVQVNSAAHYTRQTADIEYVCRLLWLAVPAKNIHPEINHLLSQRIIDGTTPDSTEFWQYAKDYDQRVVEMSAIAMALVEAPEIYWQPLTEEQKANLSEWLLSSTYIALPPNNWYWFRVLILESLASLGIAIDTVNLDAGLQSIDDMQLEQGWYEDGATGVMDYYNPMAFQLYALMYCRWNPQSPKAEVLLSNALEFAKTYIDWFDVEGRQLAYGRSLNYRFAALAFWAELARVNPEHADIGLWRTLWTRGMHWWADQPISDSNGMLLPGFAYPNLLMSEFYTSSVSPLLAFKAFNALAMEETHPFWQADVTSLSHSTQPQWVNDRHLQWRNGGSYLLTNASGSNELRECGDKYYKFAYSSAHGFCIDSVRWINQGWAGDNILAFQHPDTMQWYSRPRNIKAYRDGDTLVSVWSPFNGCQITTYQTLQTEHEIRVHRITSDRELSFLMTGYCVDEWRGWFSHAAAAPSRIESSKLFSELRLVKGQGQACCYPCAPNTNVIYPHSSVPAISGVIQVGDTNIEVHVLAGSV
ncbi:DUF2264 domain-containing protein [Vibrio diazotrophicus]|uniref:DUF2264 domain-containing protein n=1 Tax=Vibrio diazotrophicus TaxID=685 RepID=UPI00142DB6DE|nr:DUF2264 domain-containing protein [Vibrio diazotrophicus]NIY91929.1 DUF2264 domain-containing protein [Vibrio diazotrophicus]